MKYRDEAAEGRDGIDMSLPVRGAWIEIRPVCPPDTGFVRRSPCGERGLKFHVAGVQGISVAGRSPCGERGLKCKTAVKAMEKACRSPCGERGLKSPFARLDH